MSVSPVSPATPHPAASTRRRPLVDLSATLVRRGYVCDYEAGERPLPQPDKVLRLGRAALLPISTVACVRTEQRVVALTYDDGPDPDFTPGVLDALGEQGMRATFFVMVGQAEKHPEIVRRIQANGHEVALHGIDHTKLNRLPLRQAVALIREGKQRLEQITQRRITIFRPTAGAQSLQQYLATRALGLEVVIWSASARDWEASTEQEVADRAVGALHQGGFMLLHDFSGSGTATPDVPTGTGLDRGKVTELLLAGMVERGYTCRTVSQLLAEYPAVRTVWAERG